jgi:hypothetical protein
VASGTDLVANWGQEVGAWREGRIFLVLPLTVGGSSIKKQIRGRFKDVYVKAE